MVSGSDKGEWELMTVSRTNYSEFFKIDSPVKGVIVPTSEASASFNGQIRRIKNDLLTVELLGDFDQCKQSLEIGRDVSMTVSSGWSICRCKGTITKELQQRELLLRLHGPITEKQNRNDFRMDVVIPISYHIPEKQRIDALKGEWHAAREIKLTLPPPVMRPGLDGACLVSWQRLSNLEPLQVNLSQNGMCFKSPEFTAPGTLLFVHLFLPLTPPQVIPLIAEVLRCDNNTQSRLTKNTFATAMRFSLLHEADRKMIFAFVLAEQRKLMRVRSGYESCP